MLDIPEKVSRLLTFEPIYVRLRQLKPDEVVHHTTAYHGVAIDFDAENKIIGVEVLQCVDITFDGISVINWKPNEKTNVVDGFAG